MPTSFRLRTTRLSALGVLAVSLGLVFMLAGLVAAHSASPNCDSITLIDAPATVTADIFRDGDPVPVHNDVAGNGTYAVNPGTYDVIWSNGVEDNDNVVVACQQSTPPSTPPSTAPSTPPSTAPSTPPSTAPSTPPSTAPSTPPSTAPSTPPSTAPSVAPSGSVAPIVATPVPTLPPTDSMSDGATVPSGELVILLAMAGILGVTLVLTAAPFAARRRGR